MKKIGILTFQRALNYGAVLQAYGLVETLKKNINDDYTIEIIDYRSETIEKTRSIKTRLDKVSIKNLLRAILLVNKKYRFNKFNKFLPISKKKYDNSNIEDLKNDYYKIIVGSDQVWNSNITNSDYNYLLDFDFDNKYSYAASIGQKKIDDNNISSYRDCLSKFRKISVREIEGKNILKEQLNIECDGVHLDPALLLEKKDWEKIATQNSVDKYILIYNVLKPDHILDVAKKISSQTGYKIKIIPNGINPKIDNSKKYFPDVVGFLNLFKNAEYILTNSFHGTVFSIIFNKKMLIELKKNGSGNDRIITLLNKCNLSDRILNLENIDILYNDIDWKNTNKLLDDYRQESIEYLRDVIKDVEVENEKQKDNH